MKHLKYSAMPKKVIDIFTNPETPEPKGDKPEINRSEDSAKLITNKENQDSIFPDRKIKTKPDRKRFRKVLIFAVVALFIFYGLHLINLKDAIISSSRDIQAQFQNAVGAFKKFNLDKVQTSLKEANRTINTAYNSIEREGIFKISFRAVPDLFKSLFYLGETSVDLAANSEYLAENAFSFILNQEGDKLIAGIKNIKNNLDKISDWGLDLQEKSAALGFDAGADAAKIDGRLFAVNGFLSAFINWLESPRSQNILILFQNISEMRPGGGFVGSYGVANLNHASLTDLDVRNIYDPDGQLDLKVVPPRPLQLITSNWGARDANWFFNFPTSAKKIIYFLEQSKMYKEKGVEFSAVIAVNTNVIADILTVTGPIALPEYNRIITDGNVLDALQEEVRSGKDRTRGEPKRIIKVLAPLFIKRLGTLTDPQKQELFKIIALHVEKKDIVVYFKDLAIQSYLDSVGAAGTVAKLPNDFSGDYLAVADANVGGAKTDAVVRQMIELNSIIDLSGDIHNRLTITRAHNGDKRTAWWYKKTNKNYMQIFTRPGTKLISLTGQNSVRIIPPVNYKKLGYQTDPDLKTIETSDIVFGKSVLRTWLFTEPGHIGRLEYQYENSPGINLNQKQIPYTFIFDRQSGIRGGIKLTIKAPGGYHWKNTGARIFQYDDPDPAARIKLDLTLSANTQN